MKCLRAFCHVGFFVARRSGSQQRTRSLNRDIQGLHTRLVSLEVDKLVEIEHVLTKEQLRQLREIRQNVPITPKLAAGRTGPA